MTLVLMLGTADWSQAIATNQHYMARELAKEWRVVYTESLGLRSPELSKRDILRMIRRISGGPRVRAGRPIPENVAVRSPRVIPRHVGLARRVNSPRLRRLVHDWISYEGPRVLWTYSPVTYGLEQFATCAVYHCVDLLGEVEGISSALIDSAESVLARRVDLAIATSDVVAAHLRSRGFGKVESWPNVADTAVIESARPSVSLRQSGRVVFAGNLSALKVDFAILRALVRRGADLHLAGPVSEGGGRCVDDVQSLVSEGATYHGLLSPDRLANLYWTCEVGIIPYVLNSYTRGVSPLKTYEYLAAGLKVVSTPVPAVEPVEDHVFVEESLDAFVSRTLESQGMSHKVVAARAALAREHSWDSRGQAARHVVSRLLSDSNG